MRDAFTEMKPSVLTSFEEVDVIYAEEYLSAADGYKDSLFSVHPKDRWHGPEEIPDHTMPAEAHWKDACTEALDSSKDVDYEYLDYDRYNLDENDIDYDRYDHMDQGENELAYEFEVTRKDWFAAGYIEESDKEVRVENYWKIRIFLGIKDRQIENMPFTGIILREDRDFSGWVRKEKYDRAQCGRRGKGLRAEIPWIRYGGGRSNAHIRISDISSSEGEEIAIEDTIYESWAA